MPTKAKNPRCDGMKITISRGKKWAARIAEKLYFLDEEYGCGLIEVHWTQETGRGAGAVSKDAIRVRAAR